MRGWSTPSVQIDVLPARDPQLATALSRQQLKLEERAHEAISRLEHTP